MTDPDILQGEAGEHFTKLLQALADVDKLTQACISDELKARIPAYEAAVDDAAAVFRAAIGALETPESTLADIDGEIVSCREQIAYWGSHLDDKVMKDRVEAKSWQDSYSAELVKLEAKREQAEQAIQPFYDSRNKGKDGLAQAQHRLDMLITNLDYPYLADGRRTDAYLGYRVGSWWLWLVILTGNKDHPEWDTCMQMIQTACKITGYRSTDLELEDMDRERLNWDSMKGTPEPVPSGAEVRAAALTSASSAIMFDALPGRRRLKTPAGGSTGVLSRLA